MTLSWNGNDHHVWVTSTGAPLYVPHPIILYMETNRGLVPMNKPNHRRIWDFFYGACKFFDQHKLLYMYHYGPCILLWFGWSMGMGPFLILCILLMVIGVYLCPCAETSFVEIHRTIRIRHHRS